MTMFGRRAAPRRTEMPAWARTLLLTGDEPKRGEEGHREWVGTYFLAGGPPGEERGLKALWERYRPELMAEWMREHPGQRPWGWWEFDAPGPRQKVGGSGVLYEHGQAVAKFDLPGDGFWDVDPDPRDPPQFESQAAYLKRVRLLMPGEEARIPKREWQPVTLEVDGEPSETS